MTGSSGSVAGKRRYDAYGNATLISGGWYGTFGHAGGFGYQEDFESGLQLLGHRYYDPSLGRFITRDPIYAGSNWFRYSEANPNRWVDPSGTDINRLLATGNWNASDIEYEGGLLGLDDATNRWLGHFGNEQWWALPVGTLGYIPFGGPSQMRAGARGSTSNLRIASMKYRNTKAGSSLKAAATLLKRASLTPVMNGKGKPLGHVPALVAWFSLVEAAAAIKAGVATYNEPNRAKIELLVNSKF